MRQGPILYRPLDILWPHLQAPRNRAARNMIMRVKNRGWNIKGKALPVEQYQTLAKVVRNPQNAWYRPMQEGLW